MARIVKKSIYNFALVCVAISTVTIVNAETFVREDIIVNPTPSKFTICHGGTCEYIETVSLEGYQWQQIRTIFKDNTSARVERENIKKAIAKFEKIVGRLTNTYNDRAENEADEESYHYMDCIDESTNTTLYLMMLQNDGLLKWHRYQTRGNRGYFFNGWPHTTAVIKVTQSGERYAVDSWFLDNGQPPYIIPLKQWRDGWKPR